MTSWAGSTRSTTLAISSGRRAARSVSQSMCGGRQPRNRNAILSIPLKACHHPWIWWTNGLLCLAKPERQLGVMPLGQHRQPVREALPLIRQAPRLPIQLTRKRPSGRVVTLEPKYCVRRFSQGRTGLPWCDASQKTPSQNEVLLDECMKGRKREDWHAPVPGGPRDIITELHYQPTGAAPATGAGLSTSDPTGTTTAKAPAKSASADPEAAVPCMAAIEISIDKIEAQMSECPHG